MGKKQVKFEDGIKKKKNKSSNNDVNNIMQFFEIVFVIIILFLIFSSELVLMNFHVLSSNIGWMVMMVQGLLVFRGINPIFRKILGDDTIFIHWVAETTALVGATIGFACAYTDKNFKNKEHFVTWHAIFGLIGFGFSIMSGINGVPTLYRKELKRYISPKWNKFFHILTGTIGFFFGGLALIMSCCTKWFAIRTSYSSVTFCIGIILVVCVVGWTIIRPITKVRGNWRKLMSKD